MDVGALLKSFIYLVSSALLYPALVLLSALVLWMLAFSGSFAAEWLSRHRLKRTMTRLTRESAWNGDSPSSSSRAVQAYCATLSETLAKLQKIDEALIENLLQRHSAALWESLDTIRLVIRIGPGLGLIGTLIPMGTGLAALGQGDITRLSSDLVIAFTTTVVGLALGLVAYAFYWSKRRWIEDDIRTIEYCTEIMVREYGVRTQSH